MTRDCGLSTNQALSRGMKLSRFKLDARRVGEVKVGATDASTPLVVRVHSGSAFCVSCVSYPHPINAISMHLD